MKQFFSFLTVAVGALFFPAQNTVHAQAQETRSRFIAKTFECFDGSNFYKCNDSLRINWHDTAGAEFDYLFQSAYGVYGREGLYAYEGYSFETFIGYDTISPRAFAEASLYPFDTTSFYAPSGTGFLPNPRYQQTQVINSSNIIESMTTTGLGPPPGREEYFYNASGDRIATKNYYDGPPSTLASIDSFKYDNNGNLLSSKKFYFSGGVINQQLVYEYIYNSNNRVVQSDYSTGNGTTLSLAERTVHTYSAAGQRTSTVNQYKDTSGVLRNSLRYNFSYNSNGQTLSRSREVWSGTTWDTTGVIRYGYGSFDAPELAYVQIGAIPDTNVKIRYFFNSDGLSDSIISYTHLGAGQWLPRQKGTFLYNEFDQPTFRDFKSGWNSTTQTWSYIPTDARMYLYYETFDTRTGMHDLAPSLTFSLYPNPARDVIHIRSGSEPIRMLSVYDLTGRLLIRRQPGYGNREVTLGLASLSAGAYILKVEGAHSSGSKKIMVY